MESGAELSRLSKSESKADGARSDGVVVADNLGLLLAGCSEPFFVGSDTDLERIEDLTFGSSGKLLTDLDGFKLSSLFAEANGMDGMGRGGRLLTLNI